MCTLTVRLKKMNKKDKTNNELQLCNIDTNIRQVIRMVQHF